MARKGENIFKCKDGRWEAQYIKGYELSGRIRYGFCYGRTYQEAKEKAAQCRVALLNNTLSPVTNNRRRFTFFCEEWLCQEKGKVKDSIYVKYDTILRKHILPKLVGAFRWGSVPR